MWVESTSTWVEEDEREIRITVKDRENWEKVVLDTGNGGKQEAYWAVYDPVTGMAHAVHDAFPRRLWRRLWRWLRRIVRR